MSILRKNKTGAMEMTVGTIVTIVLLMAVLVLGLVLTRTIFRGATDSVTDLDSGVKQEINNLFGEENKNLVISLGSQKTARVKQGTENFGIPIGYAPDNPSAWSGGTGCRYSISVDTQKGTCSRAGWSNPTGSIFTGTNSVTFDEIDGLKGYALVKMSIPETVAPCFQRFNVAVGCPGGEPTRTSYFDIEVIKRGLF